MEDRKEKIAPWLSVPQFGDWDLKGGQVPDYSLDFSKIREMRKQNKRDVSRASLGNDEELISSATTKPSTAHTVPHNYSQDHSPTNKMNHETHSSRSGMSYSTLDSILSPIPFLRSKRRRVISFLGKSLPSARKLEEEAFSDTSTAV